MDKYNVYQDMSRRTGGEIYLGVVGPVRTGKSTFIKRFMELVVLPEMTDENEKARTVDELPQSATGRTIMTTEPKFVPKRAPRSIFPIRRRDESASSTAWDFSCRRPWETRREKRSAW